MSVTLRWRFELPVSTRAAWAAFSDTDRFNRAAGLGFTFTEHEQLDGTVMRRGQVRKLGMNLVWDELPWEYEAPRWFRIRRRFHSGPVGTVQVECRIDGDAQRCEAAYTVLIEPRAPWWQPVVWADAKTAIKPQLGSALERLVALLRGEQVQYDPVPDPLPDEVVARLEQALSKLSHPRVAQGLSDVLRHAPLREQDRLLPRQLATRWEVTEPHAVMGCLEAVREGVLTLGWELLCPSCQGPKQVLQTLDAGPVPVHCPTCNIAYDGTFPDSVNVVFRPATWVRDFEVVVACALSPARTPAVIAAAVLAPGEERELTLFATPGSYRVLPVPGATTAVVEVEDDAPAATALLTLTEDGRLEPPVCRLQPGASTLVLRNACERTVQLQVKRRWRPPWTLTAGHLLSLPGGRQLLPPYAIDPGLQVEVGRAAVLAVEVDQDVETARALLHRSAPTQLYAGDGRLVATWPHFEQALRAAEGFACRPDQTSAVTVGPVAVLTRGAHTVPSGRAVEEALRTLRGVGASRTAMPGRLVDDPEVHQALVAVSEVVAVGRRPLEERPALLVFPRRLDAAGEPYDIRQTVAGVYRVDGVVGQGGMGTVYAATDLVGGGEVVVKVLKPRLSADPDHVQRFFTEARVLQRLEHPHIVELHDWGQDGFGRLYLAMERLPGRPLDALLEDAPPLAPARAVRLVVDAAHALHAAHQRGIVHRDIKPDNLFCSPDGRGTVLDFGIALDRSEAVEEGEVWGTPRYMAPEQIEGDPLDGRADAYSLALVLYALLTHQEPFPAGSAMASAMKRTVVAPVPLDSHGIALPEPLVAVVHRQLSLEPGDRYPTALAFAEALEAAVR